MPVSGALLLRMIRAPAIAPHARPRVLGVDDWAWRRGHRYGTIVVDLERKTVIDLLPDRQAEIVAERLRKYPGIQILARDRAGAYAEIADRLGTERRVIRRWLRLGHAPLWSKPPRYTMLDARREYLEQRWTAGCRNAALTRTR